MSQAEVPLERIHVFYGNGSVQILKSKLSLSMRMRKLTK